MDLKQMEYFVRVAESGSFTRAALMLEVAQSSLSRQIRLLEVELRQNLFYRNGRGADLTDAGKRFFEHARAMLESAERARSDLSELGDDPTGRIVIGLPPRVARTLAAPLVQAFRQRFPRASICISEALSTALHEWLLLGRIELALLFGAIPSPQLELKSLFREEMLLVGHADETPVLPGTVKFAQLADYPLILPQMPNATRVQLESVCRKTGTTLNVPVELDTVQAILELILLRQGYGIIPESAVITSPRRRELRTAHVQKPGLWSQIVLASSRQRPMTKLAHQTRGLMLAMDIPRLFVEGQARI